MRLRAQLLLLALVTLVLPWAGWQFARELERGLREGQAAALTDSAQALAAVLEAQRPRLPPAGPVFFVHEAPAPIRVDADRGDWQPLWPHAQRFEAEDGGAMSVALARFGGALHLYLESARSDPNAHLRLRLDRGAEVAEVTLAPAPGGAVSTVEASVGAPRLLGQWRRADGGVAIELRMLDRSDLQRLGIEWRSGASVLGTAPDRLGGLWPLVAPMPELERLLQRLAPPGLRLSLLHPGGWPLAAAGSLQPLDARAASEWRQFLYRLLADDAAPDDPAPLAPALAGGVASGWQREPGGPQLKLVAAAPVREGGEIAAVLRVERRSEAALLAGRALSGLLGVTLLAMFAVGGVLIAYASWLSWRVRRLMRAVDRAMDGQGDGPPRFRGSPARDEIGELSRRFARLLDEVAGYTEYLRTLAGKLSHELNTPLAIVRSSLENLDAQALPAGADAYLARARDGTDRMFAIVRAMSEATRVERAIASADAEDFDLRAMVAGCAEGYRDLLAPRRLELLLPPRPLPFRGAPELLAQALDKLVDNARSFCPDDGWVAIALAESEAGAELSVANAGPPLPATARERLFDSLVSLRGEAQRRAGGPHLGLGLHIVRLIAELHRGEAFARDLPDGAGVEFRMRLRGMP